MAAEDLLTEAEALAVVDAGTTGAQVEPYVTAVSQRLDELCGPIVQRSVADEVHAGGCRDIRLRHWPVAAVTSVVEWDSDGNDVTLTRETRSVKPAEGYLLRQYSLDPALFGPRVERRQGGAGSAFEWGVENVVVNYTAGRFTDTGNVSELFKSAARLFLEHLFAGQQSSVVNVGEFPVVTARFPSFGVPNAVVEMLGAEVQT